MKRIALFVLSVHVVILLWMALWMPVEHVKKKELAIRTIMQAPSPVQEIVSPPKQPFVASTTPASVSSTKVTKQAPTKKPLPKKPAKKKTVAKKPLSNKPVIPAKLLRDLQESIAKIEQKDHKGQAFGVKGPPKMHTGLKIDETSIGGGSNYVGSLIDCLQSALDLPEMGAVKVELKLRKDGSFAHMKVLHTVSKRNKQFLETELPSLSFPAFTGSLQKEKEHVFVITFCNQ